MGSFSQSSFSSPVIVLSPQHLSDNYNMLSASSFQTSPDAVAWPPSQSITPASAAGRKRSREDAAEDLEDDRYVSSFPSPIQELEEDWEYGEGMVLIKPNGYIVDASSQTGTWVEERAGPIQPGNLPAAERPAMRCHKSQRLDLAPAQSFHEEVSFAKGISSLSSPVKSTQVDPTVDDFTLYLGIGWSRISNEDHLQAAARGWARYIENHYPVADVHLRLQSKGLASYLVEAREGWFLFGEDLKQGRLVSQSLERAFNNLKSTPPVFDSDVILIAASETPKNDINENQAMGFGQSVGTPEIAMMSGTVNQGHVSQQVLLSGLHHLNEPAGQACEIEMDMS